MPARAKNILLFLSLFIASILVPCQAQDTSCQPGPMTTQSPSQLKMCEGKRYAKANKQLNNTYKQIMEDWKGYGTQSGSSKEARAVSTAEIVQIRNAEIAWIKYKRAFCHTQAIAWQGSGLQPAMVKDCLTALTHEQNANLKMLEPAR